MVAVTSERPPPSRERDDPVILSCLEGIDSSETSRIERPAQVTNPRAVRETRLELLREAVHEACWFIRLHAEACQPLVEAGDDVGLLHSLGRLVIYTKHAARVGNELRDLCKEPPP
jgi:hypothetical protein